MRHDANVEFKEARVWVLMALVQELIFVVDSYSLVLTETGFIASVCQGSN